MKYSAHKLLSSGEGFKPVITPSEDEIKYLKQVRQLIRKGLRHAFKIVMDSLVLDSSGRWQLNSNSLPESIVDSIRQLPSDQKAALKKLAPKFASQGSFIYGTMNTPCHQPPQQMDLDDGVYLPIEVLREGPIVGKGLFFKIVDAVLEELADIHSWRFVGDKPTCSRVIVRHDMHVDVPLYAIPRERYEVLALNRMDESLSFAMDQGRGYLDSDDVYLAVRNKEHWIKSDPAKISRWFLGAVQDHGEILRRICRYLKAWRDYQFTNGGPSSITLMACAVGSFKEAGKRFKDDSEALLFCTERLYRQLQMGVANPVDESEPDLFPKSNMSENEKELILSGAERLKSQVKLALLNSINQQDVVSYLTGCFGSRIPNRPDLIQAASVVAVMSKPPKPQPQPKVENMQAG